MIPIAELVQAVLKRLDPNEATAITQIQRIWPEAVGPDLAPHLVPLKMHRGHLKIRADGSAWVQECHFRKDEILGQLRARLPDITIRRLSAST